MNEATKILKEKNSHGYDIYIKLPIGKSLPDFQKLQLALEQYLNYPVEMDYEEKSIKISVSIKSLLKIYCVLQNIYGYFT
jgi:hypothetical protein